VQSVGEKICAFVAQIKDIFALADFAENEDFNLKILIIVKKIRLKFVHSRHKKTVSSVKIRAICGKKNCALVSRN